jgi:hypothetical protein
VAYAFDIDDLETWAREVDRRGVRLAAEPSDGETGLFAEAVDPDGNLVVFREPASVIPAPHAAAEAFEDDEAPRRAGFRKPVKKGSKAVSRVALRPEYKTAGKPGARKGAARRTASVDGKPKPNPRLKSVRGAGPERTRLEPRKKNDPQRVTTKPAIGRLRKAERRTLANKKRAVATRSRSRPVKRASANRSAKRANGRTR